jgi:hypothetical protein
MKGRVSVPPEARVVLCFLVFVRERQRLDGLFGRYTIAKAILQHILDALLAGICVAIDWLVDADIVRVVGVVVIHFATHDGNGR